MKEEHCGFIPCTKKATKTLKLSYATYHLCDEHYAKYAFNLIKEDGVLQK